VKAAACKALDVFFWQLKKKGLPPEVLAEGTGYSVKHLRNKHERIEWSAFVRFMANAGRVWPGDELVNVGAGLFSSPYFRPFSAVARLMFTAKEVYRWIFAKSNGVGNQMFAGIEPSFRDLGNNNVLLEIRFPADMEMCPEFFLVCKGSFIGMPKILGLPPSTVDMEFTDRGALFYVKVPPGGGFLGRVKKALMWPFCVRAAPEELKQYHASHKNN
jgi:hypothetical protein